MESGNLLLQTSGAFSLSILQLNTDGLGRVTTQPIAYAGSWVPVRDSLSLLDLAKGTQRGLVSSDTIKVRDPQGRVLIFWRSR